MDDMMMKYTYINELPANILNTLQQDLISKLSDLDYAPEELEKEIEIFTNSKIEDVTDMFFLSYIEDIYYRKICEFEKSEYEDIATNDLKQILYKPNIESDQKYIVYNSYFELYEKEFRDRFLKSLDCLYTKDITDSLGKDTLKYLAENDTIIQKRYSEVSKEIDLDNDGVPNRIDIDDTKNSVQTVDDLDKVGNSTNKEVQEGIKKEKRDRDLER